MNQPHDIEWRWYDVAFVASLTVAIVCMTIYHFHGQIYHGLTTFQYLPSVSRFLQLIRLPGHA